MGERHSLVYTCIKPITYTDDTDKILTSVTTKKPHGKVVCISLNKDQTSRMQ